MLYGFNLTISPCHGAAELQAIVCTRLYHPASYWIYRQRESAGLGLIPCAQNREGSGLILIAATVLIIAYGDARTKASLVKSPS